MPDPLDAVRDAERLVREATERAAALAGEAAGRVPPRGYAVPGDGQAASPFPDLSALSGAVELLRGSVPPELARQLSQALRELLIALRAVLDYSIERLEPGAPAPVQVEDIPIE